MIFVEIFYHFSFICATIQINYTHIRKRQLFLSIYLLPIHTWYLLIYRFFTLWSCTFDLMWMFFCSFFFLFLCSFRCIKLITMKMGLIASPLRRRGCLLALAFCVMIPFTLMILLIGPGTLFALNFSNTTKKNLFLSENVIILSIFFLTRVYYRFHDKSDFRCQQIKYWMENMQHQMKF